MRVLTTVTFLLLILVTSASAIDCHDFWETYSCQFDDPQWEPCGTVTQYCNPGYAWPDMWFETTTEEDCQAGSCVYTTISDGLKLYGARLFMDFNIYELGEMGACAFDLEIQDNCGIGCTQLWIYELYFTGENQWEQGEELVHLSNSTTGEPEILSIEFLDDTSPLWGNFRVVVSSCEGLVSGFEILLGFTPTEMLSWSTVKAAY